MKILSLLFALLQLQFQFEQAPLDRPQAMASVNGVVIDSQTKQPLGGATVTAQGGGGFAGKMIVVTGNDGRFTLRNLTPGAYTIEASRAGYVSEMIGNPLSAATLNAPIVQQLNSGQVLSDIRLALTPGGVITGRLTDDHGEPVVGTIIQAFKTTYRDGLRERTAVQSVVSNDLGEYRFFMLKPGQYYIAVFPPTGVLNFTIPLFYPGTVDANAATPVDLHVGETIERLDFSSIPTKNRRITGGVQGNGNDGVSVILSPANGIAKKTVSITRDDVNPSFQFTDVIPGTYARRGERRFASRDSTRCPQYRSPRYAPPDGGGIQDSGARAD
jgi:protocatechuate 3,4-dioxygenase beta subunit